MTRLANLPVRLSFSPPFCLVETGQVISFKTDFLSILYSQLEQTTPRLFKDSLTSPHQVAVALFDY